MTAACEVHGPVDDGFGQFGFWCYLQEGLTNQEGFLYGFSVGGEAFVNWPAYDFFDFGTGDANTGVNAVENDFDMRNGFFKFVTEFEQLTRPAQRWHGWGGYDAEYVKLLDNPDADLVER